MFQLRPLLPVYARVSLPRLDQLTHLQINADPNHRWLIDFKEPFEYSSLNSSHNCTFALKHIPDLLTRSPSGTRGIRSLFSPFFFLPLVQIYPGAVELMQVIEDFIHIVGLGMKDFHNAYLMTGNLGENRTVYWTRTHSAHVLLTPRVNFPLHHALYTYRKLLNINIID